MNGIRDFISTFISTRFSNYGRKNTALLPDWWLMYEAAFRNVPQKMPVDQDTFVVFDTETTGLDYKRHQLLSIGAVKINAGVIAGNQYLERYFHVSEQYEYPSVLIHGILKKTGETKTIEGIRDFLQFAGTSVLVGHHVGFDVAMINETLKKTIGKSLKNKMIDTAHLAKRITVLENYSLPKTEVESLDALCAQYNIVMHDRHTAAGDAFLTAILFLKLTARLKKRGIQTTNDLLNTGWMQRMHAL